MGSTKVDLATGYAWYCGGGRSGEMVGESEAWPLLLVEPVAGFDGDTDAP